VVQLAQVAACLLADLAARVVRRVPGALQLPQGVVGDVTRIQPLQDPVQVEESLAEPCEPRGIERPARAAPVSQADQHLLDDPCTLADLVPPGGADELLDGACLVHIVLGDEDAPRFQLTQVGFTRVVGVRGVVRVAAADERRHLAWPEPPGLTRLVALVEEADDGPV
jgi:hypothetical protein